jgi:NAD(P)-dependent dehydrogenase (short-subunit alcohol dehydrogenase family)
MGRLLPYDASKSGLVTMTRSLALELGGHRIRVNAVLPGAIQTPGAEAALSAMAAGVTSPAALKARLSRKTPLGRMGEPDDVARAVLFLASSASEYVTGSALVVDGGLLLA